MIARVLLIAGLVALAGCGGGGSPDPEPPTVVITVPKGFTGPVWVVADPSGIDVPSQDRVYRVPVPKNGLVRVKSTKLLEEKHKPAGAYDDGSPLAFEDADPNVVCLRGGAIRALIARAEQEITYVVYYVGDEAQAVKFFEGDTKPKFEAKPKSKSK
jgi:hypothetical protein